MIYRNQGPREGGENERETGDATCARVFARLDAQEELFWQTPMYFSQAAFSLVLWEANYGCGLGQWILLAD